MTALVFDLGGTHLRAAVAHHGQLVGDVQKTRIQSVNDSVAPAQVWDGVVQTICGFAVKQAAAVPANAPIVIAFPGPISTDGFILDAPTLVGESGNLPDLRDIIGRSTGRDVHLLNDMSAAAWQVSKSTVATRFLVVTVSSGIGSKIFDREHPRRVLDDVAYAGEIGHAVVDTSPHAPICDCGGRGHLGAIASGRGINREARRRAQASAAPFLASLTATRFGATPENLSNELHLVPAIRAGDAWALAVLEDCVAPLAGVIATVVLAAGIQRVVLIGGFAQAALDAFMAALHGHLAQHTDYAALRPAVARLVIAPSPTDEVCLLGAAVFAEEQLGC